MILSSSFMKSLTPSAIRSITSQIADKTANGTYVASFAGGRPAAELFPYKEIGEITHKIFTTEDPECIQYGPSSGYTPLRKEFAQLMKRVSVNVDWKQVFISAGAGQAISYISRALLSDGHGTVVCENPTYVASIDTFRAFGANVIGVEMEADGMNLVKLEEILKKEPIRFIYTIPDFQNPTGATMSIEKRKKLVELAKKYNTVIVEDAPYALVNFTGEIQPAIKSFDVDDSCVVYIGSVSKIICPGLRVGWIVADAESVQRLIYIRMRDDSFCNTLAERQVYHFLHDYDFDQHLNKISASYKSRKDCMVETIHKTFPKSCEIIEPNGGLFVWVKFEGSIDTTKLFDYVFEKNIAFVPGTFFYADRSGLNTLRLSFATVTEDVIEAKISELGNLISDYLERGEEQ